MRRSRRRATQADDVQRKQTTCKAAGDAPATHLVEGNGLHGTCYSEVEQVQQGPAARDKEWRKKKGDGETITKKAKQRRCGLWRHALVTAVLTAYAPNRSGSRPGATAAPRATGRSAAAARGPPSPSSAGPPAAAEADLSASAVKNKRRRGGGSGEPESTEGHALGATKVKNRGAASCTPRAPWW